MVHHKGSSPDSGHYTACNLRYSMLDHEHILNKSHQQWVEYDDSNTKTINIDEAIKNQNNQINCYMATYVLK